LFNARKNIVVPVPKHHNISTESEAPHILNPRQNSRGLLFWLHYNQFWFLMECISFSHFACLK